MVAELLRPGGVTPHVQPVVRVADSAIIGYEVLSRADAFPTISPDRWLAAAEQAGRRADVELACIEAATGLGEPPDRALLFVNISPDVLLDPRFLGLADRLPRHVLEVTEHAAVADYGPLRAALGRLRGSGSLVAVDDVGSGYASMAHVLQLNPSFIKIDRSLVQGLDADPGRRALVDALQAFAAAVGALTIAEGVETQAELRELRSVGVDLAQGYLLGRPAPTWTQVSPVARDVLVPTAPAPGATDATSLLVALEAAVTAVEACDVVGRFLARKGGLLPSIYLERGGVLRCHSRRGQWLVMDGLHPGSGITGAAFADGKEVICHDISADDRYRLAIPGVCAEVAVPMRVNGQVVGVINVDTVAPLQTEHIVLVQRCARVLERRLAGLTTMGSSSTVLHELSRLAPGLALAVSPADVCSALLRAVTELSGFESGCLWSVGVADVAGSVGGDGSAGGAVTERQTSRVEAVHGPDGALLASLEVEQVTALATLVTELSSCYSGGTDLSLDVPPTHVLRERGARGAILVPIRDGWRLTDVLVLTSTTTSYVPADVVDAVENLCLQAGSRLAALRRVAELEELVHRDALTGVGNRGLWDVAMADPTPDGHPPRPFWLAVADVDRFKAVNDSRGHLTGDLLLRRLAELFAGLLPGWSVFRLGGDEFALFGPADDGAEPAVLAEVTGQAQELLASYGSSVSVGAVLTTRDRLASAHAGADRALYRCKRGGGGGLVVAGVDAPGWS
jgi:diguanylate cyclase (GGDEF)-like protein